MACFQKRAERLPRARGLGESQAPIADIEGPPERGRVSSNPGGLAGFARLSQRVEHFNHPEEQQLVDLVLESSSPLVVEQAPDMLEIFQLFLRGEHVEGFQQRLELI